MRTRLQSVDAFRVLGILAVVGLHVAQQTDPAGLGQRLDLATLMDGVERFAVPMFFALSGYFWAAGAAQVHDWWPRALSLARRVAVLFVCWCLVYLSVEVAHALGQPNPGQALRAVAIRHAGPLTLLLQGTKVHLWFLPALACAALIAGACLRAGRWRLLATLAVVLFLVGLAGKAYAPALGLAPRFNFRNGPFFSLPLFAVGVALQRRGPRPRWWAQGLLLALAGLALQLLEAYWLHARFGASMVQDFTAGTLLYGVGAAMLALSDARPLRLPGLAAAGPLVLGIYASHYLFIDVLYPLDARFGRVPGWPLAYVLLVCACALVLARVLARFAPTRRLVV